MSDKLTPRISYPSGLSSDLYSNLDKLKNEASFANDQLSSSDNSLANVKDDVNKLVLQVTQKSQGQTSVALGQFWGNSSQGGGTPGKTGVFGDATNALTILSALQSCTFGIQTSIQAQLGTIQTGMNTIADIQKALKKDPQKKWTQDEVNKKQPPIDKLTSALQQLSDDFSGYAKTLNSQIGGLPTGCLSGVAIGDPTSVPLGAGLPDNSAFPNSNSQAEKTAEQIRAHRVADLNSQADHEMIGNLVLQLIGLVLNLGQGGITTLNTLLGIFGLLQGLVPLFVKMFGGAISQAASVFLSWLAGISAGINLILAAVRSAAWWAKNATDAAAAVMAASLTGPAGGMMQGLILLLKPALGGLLCALGGKLQSQAIADYAEAKRESEMSIQEWMAQYGTCPAL